jgi:dipeptidyl aminopeptidase/acylaminoacyl peptidase
VWDAESGIEIILLEGHMYGVQSASFSPDGCRIVTASFDSTARVWDAEDGTEIVLLKGHTNLVVNASFSPDGRRIVTTSDDCTARVWDAESGTEIALLRGHRAPVHSASFSPDGRWIVTRAYDNTVRVWDVSRTATAVSERTLTLAAALGHGVGWCTDAERTDFLMQYAQHDLYAEALKQLGCKGDDPDLSEVAAALAAPLHPNCYLSPTLFAQKFVG